ncbi:MFS transporter [Brevibacillus fulvus]|uniref:PPP family 3-phenylpropionic acid transporter n=1 Tax=Brevibacillus fulvus TaxID=1125967 RepID=A0A939BVT8_9BACL|nr:MFS transporter [Brevibacillus fulvus]MBM7591061.1 PPP family 3-phenylpropionic acid transporter [Brevibacillus fulvus]
MKHGQTEQFLQEQGKAASRAYLMISGLYLAIYYGIGAFTPLIAQYYHSIHLTGTQIGLISSITPLISIVTQPMWGIICDRFQVRKRVLFLTLLAAGLVVLFFTRAQTFGQVIVLLTILSVFQSAVIPISDSLALAYGKKHNMPFGNLRMWGAVGFAVSALVTGLLIQLWGPKVLFFVFAAAFVLATLFLKKIPDDTEGARLHASIFSGIGSLLKIPRFTLFLFGAFFIYGAVNAHNLYFSLFYQHIGGSVAGVGLAFLLFAGSEAPCMKLAAMITRRWGLEYTLLTAGIISTARWFWYSTAPNTLIVLLLFFIQGLSIGFYLAAAAQYVRENTPGTLQVTALAVFMSFGQGLGAVFCDFLGGIVMQYFGILQTYLFLGLASGLGLIPVLLICFGPWKRQTAS